MNLARHGDGRAAREYRRVLDKIDALPPAPGFKTSLTREAWLAGSAGPAHDANLAPKRFLKLVSSGVKVLEKQRFENAPADLSDLSGLWSTPSGSRIPPCSPP